MKRMLLVPTALLFTAVGISQTPLGTSNGIASGYIPAAGAQNNILENSSIYEAGNRTMFGLARGEARINVLAPALAQPVGSQNNLFSIQNDTGGGYSSLRVLQYRTQLPSNWPQSLQGSWYSAPTRIQQFIDGYGEGYLEFNPLSGPEGIAFGHGQGEYMRILSNGYLGLNTTTPHSLLEVNGDIRLSAGSGAGIFFPDGTVQRTAAIGQTGGFPSINNTAGNAGFQFDPNSQTMGGTFGTGGNLGFQANNLGPTSDGDTGGSIFLGGSQRGDSLKGRVVLRGSIFPSIAGLTMDANNRVGIGVDKAANLTQALEVGGNIKASGIIFPDGSVQSTASAASTSSSASNATFGIRTSTPNGALDVAGVGGLVVTGANLDPASGYSLQTLQGSGKVLTGWNRSGGRGETDFITNSGPGAPGGFTFYNYTNNGNLTSLFTAVGTGNFGIGTDSPSARLEVNGNLKLTSGSGASIVFPDNTVQSTAWNGTLCGGDYAESVDVGADRKTYEPGDVIVIDPNRAGSFTRSTTPYSKLVAGVYSTKPGLTGRRQPATQSKEDEIPMAVVGIVPTKVSAINGPIEPGDLLVTSDIAGVAMRASDDKLRPGIAIGKAMAPLTIGVGLIEVLVSLQ